MVYLSVIIVSYLLGSIPFGWLLAKLAGSNDLRNVGSGGTGATNVMRVGGLKLAGLTWILDMAKAFLAVVLGDAIGGEGFGALCGLFAVIGHCWPVWLKFRGGKGVSSMFGMLLALSPITFCSLGIIWLIVALISGYSSLGAVAAFIIMPFFGFAIGATVGWALLGVAIICAYRHRENIVRLLRGTESKIKWKWKK